VIWKRNQDYLYLGRWFEELPLLERIAWIFCGNHDIIARLQICNAVFWYTYPITFPNRNGITFVESITEQHVDKELYHLIFWLHPHTCAITQSVHESNRIGLQLTLLLVNSILMASVLKGKNPYMLIKYTVCIFGGLLLLIKMFLHCQTIACDAK
jgi:hypothetical protein